MRDISRGTGHLTTHQKLVPTPSYSPPLTPPFNENKSSSNLVKEPVALFPLDRTVEEMPISSGHLRALTKERLAASRPTFAPIPTSREVIARRKPLLVSVIDSAPRRQSVMEPPEAISLAHLDMGRIHLPDAIRLLGWSAGTPLECLMQSDHYLISAKTESKQVIDSQGRYLLNITARRRLGISASEQMLVITYASPLPQLCIYPCSSLLNAINQKMEVQT